MLKTEMLALYRELKYDKTFSSTVASWTVSTASKGQAGFAVVLQWVAVVNAIQLLALYLSFSIHLLWLVIQF